MIKNIFKHLHLINKHKWLVFKLSVKAGIPWQGLVHDLSKYSPSEFFVGVKYFRGYVSPNNVQREVEGVAAAWLHHKGRNKHHYEYWIDYKKEAECELGQLVYPYLYRLNRRLKLHQRRITAKAYRRIMVG